MGKKLVELPEGAEDDLMKMRALLLLTGKFIAEIEIMLRKHQDLEIEIVENLPDALNHLTEKTYAFFIADLDTISTSAFPLIKRLNRQAPLTELILFYSNELEKMEAGVIVDYQIHKKLSLQESSEVIDDALMVRKLLNQANIIGRSQDLKSTARRIKQVAASDISVLVSGPSGTGKELIARAIHDFSPRANKEYISINCASIPDSLLESELFGHEKGAFTGADSKTIGLIQQADGGTLFLDEIGEMHPRLQAKLLRAIDTKTFTPVGARKPLKIDFRIISATNRDLQREVAEGNFRADLYYRIGVVAITTTRLADRPEDILPITAFYLNRLKGKIRFTQEATSLLLKYNWPGNVRELSNFLQRLLLTEPKGEVDRDTISSILELHRFEDKSLPVVTNITPEESGYRLIYQALLNLANEIAELKHIVLEQGASGGIIENPDRILSTSADDLETMEEKMIRETLDRVSGNRKIAANLLGIGERTLYRKIKKYNIN